MTQGLLSRQAAIRAVRHVLEKNTMLDMVWPLIDGYDALDPRDRAFARSIAVTSLRRLGQIRKILDECLAQPFENAPHEVQAILVTGTAQLVFLKSPPHAVVSSLMELASGHPQAQRLKKMINAVLRRIDREGDKLVLKTAPQDNLPDWMRQSWKASFGPGRTARIARALTEVPPLDITVRDGEDLNAWAEKLGADILPGGSLRLENAGRVTELPGFDEGVWWVQDVAAALPVRLMRVGEGQSVIDMCAAPGGKTLQLAARGARVSAVDLNEKRMGRLHDNLNRTGLSAEAVIADGRTWQPDGQVDAVLLDAPCSATGTLRRHPEAAWIKSPQDVRKLSGIQRDLAVASVKWLKPGGELLVCTCSLQAEEGEALAQHIASNLHALDADPVTSEELPGLETALTTEGHVRLTPDLWSERGGMDGFFISRWRKKA